MSTDTEPMRYDAHHGRAERAAVRLVESAGWKIGTNIVIPTLLAIIAWNFQGLATKVDKIAETLTTYAIQSATNDYRMRSVEADNVRQDAHNAAQDTDIRTLHDKQAAITYKLESLRQRGGERERNP